MGKAAALVKRNLPILILLIMSSMIAARAYLTYHDGNPFPYHIDEWQHLALSVDDAAKGYIRGVNPYFREAVPHTDLEPGYHLLFAYISLLTGIDLVLFAQFAPSLIILLTCVAIYICIAELGQNRALALMSVFFYSFSKTNVNILGNAFLVPLSLGIPFVFMSIFMLTKAMIKPAVKNFAAAAVMLAALLLIHPPTFAIALLACAAVIITHLLAGKRTWKAIIRQVRMHLKGILITAGILIAILIMLLAFIPQLLGLLYFEQGWGKLEVAYFIPLLFGIVPTILYIVGIMKSMTGRLAAFAYVSLFSLAVTALFNLSGFTVLLPYARAVHYAMISMAVISGYGAMLVAERIKERMKAQENGLNPKIAWGFAIIALCAISLATDYYPLQERYSRYSSELLTSKDYSSLLYIRSNYGSNSTVMTQLMKSSAVYPVSLNYASALVPAQVGGGDTTAVSKFYAADNCDDKKDALKRLRPDFILSPVDVQCPFLDRLPYQDAFLYTVNSRLDDIDIFRPQ